MKSLLGKIGKFEKARVFVAEAFKVRGFNLDIESRESSNSSKHGKEWTQKKANR